MSDQKYRSGKAKPQKDGTIDPREDDVQRAFDYVLSRVRRVHHDMNSEFNSLESSLAEGMATEVPIPVGGRDPQREARYGERMTYSDFLMIGREYVIGKPEMTTKVYVHDKSPLLGENPVEIAHAFEVQLRLLKNSPGNTLGSGDQFRILGSFDNVGRFLREYFKEQEND